MARSSRSRGNNSRGEASASSARRSSRVKDEEEEFNDGASLPENNTLNVQEMDEDDDSEDDGNDNTASFSQAFSQVEAVELSQCLPGARANDYTKLSSMNANTREKAITNLSRVLLFKALSGHQTIDRLKCIDEALNDPDSSLSECRGLGTVLFEHASKRLKNVFGFDVRPPPAFFEGMLSTNKWKDRYYVVNNVRDENGTHSRALHDNERSVEKGLLMVVLAFCYCKGDPSTTSRNTGYVARWITDEQLYRLLHCLDSNIPEEPPVKKSSSSRTRRRDSLDVDCLMKKFVDLDYVLMEKVLVDHQQQQELPLVRYSLGPRAALEIGRRQIIQFCAEILDEEPDPTMLAEIDDGFDENEEEEE